MPAFELFGLTIYPYGLAVAGSAVFALVMAALLARKHGVSEDAVSWAAVLALPLGVLGARLGYCLCAIDWVAQEGIGFFFRLTSGGYLLYGAAAGCTLALFLASRLSNVSFLKLADHFAAPAALAIALCRLAEGLAGEGFGWCVTDWFMEDGGMSVITLEDPSFFCRFPFAIADMYESWNWAVFVLEALLAMALFIALLRVSGKRPGARAVLLALGYACSQILCESLRQDAVLRFGFVRINQIIGAVIIAAIVALCLCMDRGVTVKRIVTSALCIVVGILIVIAMEFALEGKISAIEWMTMDICYLIMTCGCVLMFVTGVKAWKRAFVIA